MDKVEEIKSNKRLKEDHSEYTGETKRLKEDYSEYTGDSNDPLSWEIKTGTDGKQTFILTELFKEHSKKLVSKYLKDFETISSDIGSIDACNNLKIIMETIVKINKLKHNSGQKLLGGYHCYLDTHRITMDVYDKINDLKRKLE